MKILISYSKKDEKYAEWLTKIIVNYFDDNPFKVWMDKQDLPFGSRIRQSLKTAIYDSDQVIVIMSPASVNSEWVKFEIETTNELENKINRTVLLPLLIKLAPIPESISDRLFIDCRSSRVQEINIKKLMQQLNSTNLPFQSKDDFIFYRDFAKVRADVIKSEGQITINSPIIGTFYQSAEPNRPSFVKVGDKINRGQVVCIIEAMKLFNEIESEYAGIVLEVLVEDSSPVEYDQPMFVIQQVDII